MRKRRFGRLGWEVSQVGYGMWGIAGGEGGWTGADDLIGLQARQRGVDLGINLFDTLRYFGHVDANVSVSGSPPLPADLMQQLRQHRWDRAPAVWSD